jgi:O-methyltransferase
VARQPGRVCGLGMAWLVALVAFAGCTRPPPAPAASAANTKQLYLDMLKLSLTDLLYETDPKARSMRQDGGDWPGRGLTMIGLKRLDNLQFVMEDVLAKGVPGDFIEAGAWRGGACIFMRGVLKAHGVTDRRVWVADSFEGLPVPDTKQYPADAEAGPGAAGQMAVSLETVMNNFSRYGLLDDRVMFLKGWFKDTLPKAPIEKLALLRLDGDLYESTMDSLVSLYPKLSSGGYVVVDDYGAMPSSASAVTDYRAKHGIVEPIVKIDWTGVFWRKN